MSLGPSCQCSPNNCHRKLRGRISPQLAFIGFLPSKFRIFHLPSHHTFGLSKMSIRFVVLHPKRCVCSSKLSIASIRRYSASSSKEDVMPTPFSLGHGITVQRAGHESKEGSRPLAIVCGWMGAKPRQLRRYCDFYHERNIDTLSFAVGPKDVLMPKSASKQMERVFQEAMSLEPSQVFPI
jgi:hypothetical protein